MENKIFEGIGDFMYKKISVRIYLVMILLTVIFLSQAIYDYNTQEKTFDFNNYKIDLMDENNYHGLVKLGLAPSTYPRPVEKNDIDTGIKLTDGDNIFSLIESRTWVTKDYGKTFIIKIN